MDLLTFVFLCGLAGAAVSLFLDIFIGPILKEHRRRVREPWRDD